MVWLPDGEKILQIPLFVLATLAKIQTNTQTPHAGIYSAYAYASRNKNDQLKQILLEIITTENYATFTIFNKLLNSEQNLQYVNT